MKKDTIIELFKSYQQLSRKYGGIKKPDGLSESFYKIFRDEIRIAIKQKYIEEVPQTPGFWDRLIESAK